MMLAGERDDDVFTKLCCVSSGVAVYGSFCSFFFSFHVFAFSWKFAKLPISSLCMQLALVCT